jgi:sulfoxide reductase heme-binding subunit YedZ
VRLAHDLRRNWYRVATHVAALLPLTVLVWDGLRRDLTANPIQEITTRTGETALVLLVLSLACTPANTVLGIRQAVLLRRPLGLYAFLYAALHLLTFTVLDYGLDPLLIRDAIVEKRFVLAGLSAFLLLTPLAITSTKGWQRRLGRRWRLLHRLAYLAAPVAVVHFVWLVKADIREPLLYGAGVAALLALRLPPVRRTLAGLLNRRYRPVRRVDHVRGAAGVAQPEPLQLRPGVRAPDQGVTRGGRVVDDGVAPDVEAGQDGKVAVARRQRGAG